MMAAERVTPAIPPLPPVRGQIAADVLLGPNTWFRVGGPADFLFRPADAEDLSGFLAARPADLPVTVVGVASNLLVRDGGVAGVVIRLGAPFARITIDGDLVTVGAGALDAAVARSAAKAALGGLEFLSGIPGTIGGALRMDAGAYGKEIRDVLVSATALDPSGRRHELDPAEMGLGYRTCTVPTDWIFLGAVLRGSPAPAETIAARMAEIQQSRAASQPIRSRTGGSTFANPPGWKAWELIDRAGCRGLRQGDAMVSELHTNFLINLGNATAAEIEGLGEEIRRRVFETSGVTLEWEIKRIGRLPAGLSGVPA